MPANLRASRVRYRDYKQYARRRRRDPEADLPDDMPKDIPVGRQRREPHQRTRTFGELLRAFVGLLAGHRTMLALAMGALTLTTLVGLMPTYGTKLVFDNVLDDKPLPPWMPGWLSWPDDPKVLLVAIVGTMVTMTMVGAGLSLWSGWQVARVGRRVSVSIRRRVFEHAIRLPLPRVYALKTGGITSILRQDAGASAELIRSMLVTPWRAIVQLLGTAGIVALIEPRLLLGLLVFMPVVWITHKFWIKRIRPMWRDVRATRQTIDSRSTEAFAGTRVVRTFTRERTEAASFTANDHFMARQELYVWWWTRAVDLVWQLIIPLSLAMLLLYGGWTMLSGGDMTRGTLVMFLMYLGQLLGPIALLANTATQFQNSLAGLDRVLDLLEEPVEVDQGPDAVQLHPADVRGHLKLTNVTFTYPEAPEPAVQDISFEALPGRTVAFVGPSGAGKSTLCNLIARFYDPDEGSVTLDGRNVRDIHVDSYRGLLGIVDQDIFLFDGTVADNIAYARRNATDAQIIDAARLANAHQFIEELPEGYESFIGERGVRLSGGQRQRIAIARAILADPSILILDEATSNLDTESERLIQASLGELMANRTSFVIAHRLSTITHADLILVLESGQIVERGRHDELIQHSGRYREMIQLQFDNAPLATPSR
ncbi:MAG: ABC transporter ATP-binding protein [Phycisphaeraceae bacterium]